MNISLILVNIRSVYNVGSIFRTADSAGVTHIYLVGYTPTPIDRFKRPRKDFAKSALGAEKTVSWSHYEDVESLMEELQGKGIGCVAVEQDPRSCYYKKFDVKKSTAFMFGNEIEGLPQDIRDKADAIIEIPQRGEKESLNVSVAVGVVAYHFL